jgi:segregation and condensation protein A
MENSSRFPSALRKSLDASAASTKPEAYPGKVVMISSYPGWPGGREPGDDHGSEGEIAADTVHLTRVFHELLERVRQGPVLSMEDEPVTISQMTDRLWQRFAAEDTPLRLTQVLRHARSERALICTFLALLELVRLQMILLRQDRSFSDVLMRRNTALGY